MNPLMMAPQFNNNGTGDSGEGCWGDSYYLKSQQAFRFAFQNINGFSNEMDLKLKSFYNFSMEFNIDIFGAAEVNTNWKRTLPLSNQTMGLFEARRVATSYLTAIPFPKLYQPGGTFIVARDQLAHRSYTIHGDPKNLGRWVSMTFRGINSNILRVVVAYRPINTPGAYTTYNQQVTGLLLAGNEVCPRVQLLIDLGGMIHEWITAGEKLIIAMDFNDDVRGVECRTFFEQYGMREVLTERHGGGPPTYRHSIGGHAVDGLFCTPTLAQTVRGGYFDVGMGVHKADHRCLWIDIPYEVAFGSKVPSFIRPEARRLRCHDPRIVDRYNGKVFEVYGENQPFLEFTQMLESLQPENITPSIVRRYDEFNKWRRTELLKMEKLCRPLKMGGVPYSPDITVAMKTITLWGQRLRRIRGGKVSVRYLHRLESCTGEPSPDWSILTEEVVISRVKEAYKNYYALIRDSKGRRATFLEDLATAKAAAGDLSVAGHLKALIQREQARLDSRKLKFLLGSNQGRSSLDYVVGLDGTVAYDQVGICRLLSVENTRRFLQSQDTPFMSHPTLVADFGRLGVGPFTEAVLNGGYTPPEDVSQGTRLFLEHVMRPAILPRLPSRISTLDYKAAFRHINEKTSSSYSGLHYGHYKALFQHDALAEVEAAWMNAPFRLGFSSERSKKGLDIMLEKKEGVRQVDKLRAILLFEADYNTHAKVLSRQVMAAAEQWLAPEQYGSRNRHSAIGQAMNKRLLFDYIRLNHYPTCWVFTDAKSCYDRIVHTPASLALQRMGVAGEVVSSLFKTVASMRHYVRTGLGDSISSYTSRGIPFQGVGQGNGMGPCIWALVSSVLFDAMRSSGFGGTITSAISSSSLALMGGAFVDDLDLFSIGNPVPSQDADINIMQQGLDLWEDLLRASGGAVEPTKSEWYRIDFSWNDGVAEMRVHDPAVSTLSCLDHTQTRRQLQLKQVHEGAKTLGVWLAPDGGSTDAVRELRKVAELCADHIRLLKIQAKELWQVIQSRFLKKLHYSLLAMCFTEKECNFIMTPLVEAMLSAFSMCKKLPRAVIYGPVSCQGLGLTNMFTSQCLAHIEAILSPANNVNRHMVTTAIELTLIEAGVPGPLFLQPYCKYVTPTWVSSTWEAARLYLDLEVNDGIQGLPLLCVNDCYLMKAFAQSGQFSVTELRHINRCRLYLMVYSLADITDGDGMRLAKWAWSGAIEQRLRPRRAVWPYQERPGNRSWTLWRKALKKCFAESLDSLLDNPLGAWNTDEHFWFYSPSLGKLYTPGRLYSRGACGTYRYNVPVLDRPHDAHPAMVSKRGRGGYLCEGYRPYHKPEAKQEWSSLRDYIDSSPTSLRWALQECDGLENTATILTAITTGECVIVSDGSYQEGLSTAAYIIVPASDVARRIKAVCVIPGRSQSAFRAELGGIFAALNMLLAVISQAAVPVNGKRTVLLGCDGKSALERIKHATYTAKGSHFDLVTGILKCCQSLEARGVIIRMEHVYGHRDRYSNYEMSFMEELNVIVDGWAQHHNITCREEGLSAIDGDVFGEVGPIWVNTMDQGRVKITRDILHSAHEAIHSTILKAHWMDHNKATMEPEVDWKVLCKANSMRSRAQHLFTVKRVSGYLGVAKWLHRWKQSQTPECLICGAAMEDITHVYRCPDARMEETWHQEMEKICKWMEDSTDSDRLSEFLRKLLLAYRSTGPPEVPADLDPELQQVWADQLAIGADGLLNGFLTIRWRVVMEGGTGRCSTITWLARLTVKLYEMGGALWGRRNAIISNADGGRLFIAQQAVAAEVIRGDEGNTRVMALLQEGARPGAHSSLDYLQVWLTGVQVARAAVLPTEDRDRRGREIMYRWLRSGGSRRSS